MPHLRLILFTLLWTAVWVAPVPRLAPRVELAAGLIPFVAFGLRVFAGFFVGVPDDDAVRTAVAPLLAWVTDDAGPVPYAVVLDTTVAIGLVWFASAFDIPRESRVATAWIMPAVAVASLTSLWATGRPLEATLAARVLAAEHRLYPHALRLIASGAVTVSGEDIDRSGEQPGSGGVLFSPPLA